MRISKITNIYRFWVLQVPTHWLHFCLDSTIHIFQQTHAHLPLHEILICICIIIHIKGIWKIKEQIFLFLNNYGFYGWKIVVDCCFVCVGK